MLKIYSLEEYYCQNPPDIFYDRDYLKANENLEYGETFIATLENESQKIIYPFTKKKIGDGVYFDIITPYEYGGPFLEMGNKWFTSEFITLFEAYCYQNNIITEFVRFDPMLQNQAPFTPFYDITLSKENIVLDLSINEDKIIQNYHSNNRRDVRSSERKGVEIKILPNNSSSIDIFKEIYFSTMDSRNANTFYYFNDDYFNKISELSEEKLSIFVAYDNLGTAISAAMFLHGECTTHYHLSGTLRDYSRLTPNNLLIHKAILHAKKIGKLTFHLGGAAKSQEGLYKFKSKFSKDTVKYYIGKKIHNNDVYNSLSNDFKTTKPDANLDFFPIYNQ